MNFTQELKKLNKRQREAVEAIEGPVMVVAGPGTGKTQILTLRIANILKKTDTSPESILALTFTESAVVAMKKRLLEMIGPEAHKIAIKTIHGFCNEIIQEYPEAFPMIAGEHNISDVEQIKIIRGLLESSRQRFSRDIVASISELKREGLTPEDIRNSISDESMGGKHEELSGLYSAYQKELQRMGRYDYDDMIIAVAQVLRKNKNLRLTLQEQYLYVLVDEHQDTNQSQGAVIELLAGNDNPNLFVVGDGKQAIYRFQGAQLENFLYFRKRLKKAKVIALTENYRSTQTILDGALDVALGEGPLRANTKHPKKHISIAACASSLTESYAIARHIQERVKSGIAPEEIAVFYRTHREGAPLARYLEKLGVPATIIAGDDVQSEADFKKLIILLEAVDNFGTDYSLLPALYLARGVAPLDVVILTDTARSERRSVFSLVRDKKILEKIIPHSAAETFALYEQLSLWRAMSKRFSLMPMFEEMVRYTGLIPAGTALFNKLQEAIARDRNLTLEDFLDQLNIMRDHNIQIRLAGPSGEQSAVCLMTAHKAKGLEFDYVYIIGATSNQWESRRNRNVFRFIKKGKDEASERNLFYVALTRARKEVVVSYAKTNADGKDQLESSFVDIVRAELKKELSLERFEKELQDNPEIEFRAGPSATRVSTELKVFLAKRFLEKGLSVSALNNYLGCPTKFYFLDLIGLPQAPNAKAQAGNAAHGALKHSVSSKGAPKKATAVAKRELLERFVLLLSREPMREVDYREALKRGEKVLGAYFDQYYELWNSNMKCEFAVNDVQVGKIKLKGRLDRVDLLGGGRVRVVDYKFKKPMTRNEILGNTKNSDGNYYRQLTFYKLLIDEGTEWKMQEGMIDFIESDAKDRFRQEVFAPSDKEVAELKREIRRVSEEVLRMKFFGKKCNEKNCRYCNLSESFS